MPTNTTADRLDIADLFTRLAHLLDDKRHHDIHTVYTEDVVVNSPRAGELQGIEAVRTYLRKSDTKDEQTQHITSNILITLNGDQAQASANQLVHFYRDGEPPHQTSSLRTTYAAVRTPSGWRFREARFTLAWTQRN
jgi:3-phenylpropionate/cinnamic acid dioxygenase small subunit